MEIALPLDQMTTAEKLRVMETIWADLSRDEAQFESPSWHGEVLKEREEKIKSGAESSLKISGIITPRRTAARFLPALWPCASTLGANPCKPVFGKPIVATPLPKRIVLLAG